MGSMRTAAKRAIGGVPSIASVRSDLARVPVARRLATVIFIIIAILIARFSWHTPIKVTERTGETHYWTIPLAVDAERALYDFRARMAALAHPVPQDERVVVIAYTPETQQATGERSPLDRTILAKTLTALDGMGARAIGIDMLFDQAQPDDPELIAALKAMKTPVYLAYATNRHNPGDMQVWQQEFLDDFIRQVGNPNVKPASIHLDTDDDGVIRSWPAQPRDLPPLMPVALSGRMGARNYQGSIDFQFPNNLLGNDLRDVFTILPIDTFGFPDAAPLLAPQVKDRYVLIGGELPDADQFETPSYRMTGETTAGIRVLGAILTQTLDGRFKNRIGSGALWIIAFFVVLAGAFTSMVDVRPWVLSLLIVGQFAFFNAAPFYFQYIGIDTYGLPQFGWMAGWLLAYLATEATVKAMGSDEKKFAQSALGKYLPKDIAAMIIRDPERLSLTGERLPIYTLFTDIQGFTSLSHTLPAETTAAILNAYLDGMSDVVLEHGGTIDKFVGDAVVAFWGAPIAREDDADRALAAVLGMMQFTLDFANHKSERSLLGRTRIGLHYGESIVGNFGGEGRIQYTALGDAMNCAARLEGANKYLKSTALVSDEARIHMTAQDIFRPMGRITLSGRSTPIVVWEPAPQTPIEQRIELTRLWREFESGNKTALQELEAIAAKCDNDVALSALACRLREAGPGGSFVLGEK